MISRNGTLQEMLLKMEQLALQLANKYDPQMAEMIGQMILEQNGQPVPQMGANPEAMQNAEEETSTEENPLVERARSQSRASTQPE